MKFIKLFLSGLMFIFCISSICLGQKLSLDEVLAKHLDSIGTKEQRAGIKSSVILLDVQVIVKGSTSVINGKAVTASAGEKSVWGMNLNSADYPHDRFGFNGKDTQVGYTRPGVRSTLGGFVYTHKEVLKEGLLGGALLSSWTLLTTDKHGAKLSLNGTKKVDGKDAYVVEYSAKGGSDLTIKFYFDSKNFRHIRTEYSGFVPAKQGPSIDVSAGQTPDRYQLTEDFSDFQTLNGMTIPQKYKITYQYSGNSPSDGLQLKQNAAREIEWSFTVTNFTKNQELGENAFDIDVK